MARFTNKFIRSARPGRHSDGPRAFGLHLMVRATKSGELTRRFQQNIKVGGRYTWRALGLWPEVTLTAAREAALRNWLDARDGKAAAIPPKAAPCPTFKQMAEKWIAQNGAAWAPKTAKGHHERLALHVFPQLGSRRVDAIQTADLMALFLRLNGGETARKLRPAVRKVFALAIAAGHRSDNPAGDTLADAMPRAKAETKHMGAVPHAELGAALDRLDGLDVWMGTKLALRFQALTAARPGEVRAMDWDEVSGGVWTVPAERAKMGRPHRVPLSRQALAVLAEARKGNLLGAGLVFPAKSGGEISNNAQHRTLKRVHEGATAHGLRSSFRDWAAEAGEAADLAERSLAHVSGSQTVQAYLRTDLLERRRPLMQRWADYLSGSV